MKNKDKTIGLCKVAVGIFNKIFFWIYIYIYIIAYDWNCINSNEKKFLEKSQIIEYV